MQEETKNHIFSLENKFPDSFLYIEDFRDTLTVIVRNKDTFEILNYLKDSKETAFDFLVDITCTDYLKLGGEERFGIIYNLFSYTYHTRMRLKVMVAEDNLNVPTVIPLWKAANWLETSASGEDAPRNSLMVDATSLVIPRTLSATSSKALRCDSILASSLSTVAPNRLI